MKSEHELAVLKKITQDILDEEASVATWIPAIEQLGEIIERHTSFRIADQDIAKGETRLSSGLAISPIQAAMCMRETYRTAMFIKGLDIAIREKISEAVISPLKVLYAGCGPYALLAFPLMSIFTPEQVRFTLVEIHKDALDSAKMLLESIGLMSHVAKFVCGDATTYKIPANEKPDIIISETMNACLGKEPLVSIARNIVPQVPDATMIPQSVSIDAYLLNESKEHVLVSSDHVGGIPEPDRDRILLGKVFELNKQSINEWTDITGDQLPGLSIQIPSHYEYRYEPRLLTTINVFGSVRLKDYDSSLTYPRKFPTKEKLQGGEILRFYYELGCNPRVRFEKE
ncbi:MAG: hypothetical protein HON76_14130 [Candidatus Scalindua sp.]|jgi:hypothetical protein|nr:hypothetical protein [Candidatus Scalindua sp.]MBT5307653.1 hypothetical protein [Candidatus Scalindua sp.]MBT6230358.1 hypothetical protein [Candidatus Scalindua sp.]MBT6563657.1 hypothetical protein [Candidatus Scalindua sp.]MBT7210083.1 hypothetical protein [Candidatus Scalindua sp.]